MKHIFILLLFLGCGKVTTKSLKPNPPQKNISKLSLNTSRYDKNIDIMVAFLWPEKIVSEKQKRLMNKIITISRRPKSLKEVYFAQKVDLQKDYSTHHCQCTLNGVREEGEVAGDEEYCTEVENRGYLNDEKLIKIMEIVEDVKASVAQCGGEWLDTQSDLPDAGLSVFDFDSRTIFFSSLGSKDGLPIPYSVPVLKFQDMGRYTELKFSVPAKHGRYDFGMSLSPGKNSLTVQGDLNYVSGSRLRRGVVYWEHGPRL